MKYAAIALLSLSLLSTSCSKDKSKPNTSMTVTSNMDATWTVSNVEAHSTTPNTISISATNSAINAQIKLGLYDYREGRKTYYIDYSNSNGKLNSATYTSEGHGVAIASVGSISLTNFTTKTIEGSFSFVADGGNISGTFIAPRP